MVLGPEQTSKKRQALNMIPVKMREEDMIVLRLHVCGFECLSQLMETRASVNHQNVPRGPFDLETGCVASDQAEQFVRQTGQEAFLGFWVGKIQWTNSIDNGRYFGFEKGRRKRMRQGTSDSPEPEFHSSP